MFQLLIPNNCLLDFPAGPDQADHFALFYRNVMMATNTSPEASKQAEKATQWLKDMGIVVSLVKEPEVHIFK